jgi:GT2 family glycosyltransferase
MTDADCIAHPSWAAEILESHQKNGSLAIGGTIANGNPESVIGWAAYFCEFSAWMSGIPAGPRTDIAGANMSYKKEVFDRYGIFIAGTYCSDTEFHWRLGRSGLSLHFNPAIRVFHRNISSLQKFLLHEFQHGSAFGRVRVHAQGFGIVRRMIYALFFELIAAKLCLKVILWNLRSGRHMKRFCVTFPLTFAGILSWSFGEACGYLRSRVRLRSGQNQNVAD